MIWVRKTEEECGNYVDAEGKHYVLDWCHKVYANVTPQSLGYEPFDSMDDAISHYGLTEFVEAEEQMEVIENA